MGDREILETYLNSASKNTSETDIFPHGPKSLLTSVISQLWSAVSTTFISGYGHVIFDVGSARTKCFEGGLLRFLHLQTT